VTRALVAKLYVTSEMAIDYAASTLLMFAAVGAQSR
jgi:hypothetical protein